VGPWTEFRRFNTGEFGWYTPIIGQRFQTPIDENTVHVILYTSGINFAGHATYCLTSFPITLSTTTLLHETIDNAPQPIEERLSATNGLTRFATRSTHASR
jgi:hypothetical protein